MTKAIAAKTLIGAIEVAPASEIARSGFCHTPVKANFRDDRFCQMGDLTAEGHAPGLELCRLLLANGFDPAAPLHIYRDGCLPYAFARLGLELRCPFRTMRPDARALLVFGHGPNAIKTKPLRPAKGFCCLVRRIADRQAFASSHCCMGRSPGISCHLNSHPNGWVPVVRISAARIQWLQGLKSRAKCHELDACIG